MLNHLTILLFFCLTNTSLFSQLIPVERTIDWTIAGLTDTSTQNFIEIDVLDWGLIGDSITPNDSALNALLNAHIGQGIIINFNQGKYLFKEIKRLKSNIVFRGKGVNKTSLIFNLDGVNHAIEVNGAPNYNTNSVLAQNGSVNDTIIEIANITNLNIGDWIKITKKDGHLMTSSWANKNVGQIIQIKAIQAQSVTLSSALRLDYNTSDSSFITKLNLKRNVGFECLKIERIDETPNEQTSNILFKYAENCWVNGIESNNCNFSHVEAYNCSNIYIGNSYFHHGHDYGGEGKAYGVVLQFATNECLVENNIFERLRHSMLLQVGANANVFAFNYSFDTYWQSIPFDAAGDIVLHGNYPYLNLFEQNICRNIVIDNSHGPNGPYNTFFRNRAEGFGINITQTNSPSQNIVGNEVSNDSLPYTAVGYLIRGNNQFTYGNNIRDTIRPLGTDNLNHQSYAYSSKPDFVPSYQWAKIGPEGVLAQNKIPAYDYYNEGKFYGDDCDYPTLSVTSTINSIEKSILVYPNPAQNYFNIKSEDQIKSIKVFNALGQTVLTINTLIATNEYLIEVNNWNKGIYHLNIKTKTTVSYNQLVIR